MIQDLRYALRLMGKSPGFTAVVALTLALGIGATTANFSIVNAALLRPLPYRDSSRFTMVTDRNVRQGGLAVFFPRYRDVEEYQRRATTFEFLETATWATGPTTMTGRGAASGVVAFPVSLSFFDMLGVKAAMGRTFLPDDKNRGCSVVLAHPFWAGKLGADAKIVGQSLAALDPNLAVRDLESMRHKLATFMAYPRFRAVLLSAFAAFALLLAAVGLHGVLGQLVAQRKPEIGVRMALGASPADVAGLIARQAGAPVLAGLGIGLGLAISLDRSLSSVLYGVRPRDPATLAGASLVLLVAAVATALPACRAAKTDPVEALR